jgi:hypothetical protein
LTPAPPDAIAITIEEIATLADIFQHAHARIFDLSDADEETVASASGSVLMPSLFARAGLASIQDNHSIPLLVDEIGLLEAAVINLESYGGNEVVLVAGYTLLDEFAKRTINDHPLRHVHGVLAFTDEAGETASGPATSSLT